LRVHVYRYLNERTALWIGSVLAILAGIGDVLTGAQVAFTLVYLLPVVVVTWFRGRRAGLAMVAFCVITSGFSQTVIAPLSDSMFVLAWNLSGEAMIFILCSYMVAGLRERVDAEVRLRLAAIEELRHSERLNTLGKLAAGVAHELGTPLNVIMGRADLISGGRIDLVGSQGSARIIREQGERMTRIIRGLLEFGRRSGTDTSSEHLRSLCEETAELLRSLARTRNVEIVVGGEDVRAPVNRGEIQQVLSNLVSNAVHAMPHGGRIQLSTDGVCAKLPENNDRTERRYACITVRDHGTGIAPEFIPHIFDPFFTTKDVGEGTGLGLSVSYGIVRDHGGAIRFHTVLGEGTTFFVYLPE
jgi:signal transduction histidine kinase